MSGAPQWVRDALSDVYDPCCREKGISVVDIGLDGMDVEETKTRLGRPARA
jgi:hypothetical protein